MAYMGTKWDRGARRSRCQVGLRRLLRRADFISAPCGWEQGAKWGQIRVGSGPGGSRVEMVQKYVQIRTAQHVRAIIRLVHTTTAVLLLLRTLYIVRMEEKKRSSTSTRRSSSCEVRKTKIHNTEKDVHTYSHTRTRMYSYSYSYSNKTAQKRKKTGGKE